MEKLAERLMKYARINTQSSTESGTHPSTQVQFAFAEMLAAELKEIGLSEVSISEKCYVTATLPSNIDGHSMTESPVPVIGFISHMDTSPDMTGNNVKPRLVSGYDGGDLVLNAEKGIVMTTAEFPTLRNYAGNTLIVTDGTTLLGADDKAGIAEIVTAMEYFIQHPELKHGKVRICITPDEEIGEGADYFDVEGFGADFAYTMDGDELGSLEYENFNAAGVTVHIRGKNIHPGSAKNKMINSISIGMEFNSMLPPGEIPALTEGYEGFYLLKDFNGTVESATLKYMIRDHDMGRFEARKARTFAITQYLNEKYGKGTITLEVKDQYFNMKEKILPVFHIVELARQAMEQTGVTPVVKPIRGGTDGSRLTYMGLPTPNLFTGCANFHGRFEFAVLDSMKKATEVIISIVRLAAGA